MNQRVPVGRIVAMTTRTRTGPRWWVPAARLALSVAPVVGGAVRVTELTGGAPDNARFFASPAPVLLHIVGATVYCVAGAFQFAPALRRSGWHRAAGRILVPCGLVAALSGIGLTLHPLPAGDGDLLTVVRLVLGAGIAIALGLGLAAIRKGDVVTHQAWMVRGYAIGLGASTQAVAMGLSTAVAGTPGELSSALLLGTAWAINLLVAELIIRNTRSSR
jgi:hypothetical protein